MITIHVFSLIVGIVIGGVFTSYGFMAAKNQSLKSQKQSSHV